MNREKELVVRATGLIVLSSLAFGSLSILTVLILRSGLPLLPTMVWRYLLAATILLLVLRGKNLRSVTRAQAVRLMLVGGKFGPPVFDIAALLGKEESVARMEDALAKFGTKL